MEDKLLLATVAGGSARVVVAVTTQLVSEAQKRHDTYPVATAALGRTLTAGLLLATNLKGEDILTLRVFGDGPLGGIIVSADSHSAVRGYVQEPHTHLPSTPGGKLDVGGAVGKGFLYVSRDLGFGDPYTGSVELISGEIAEDIAQYLTVSEQTPSAVSLGVLVESDNSVIAAGGFLLQMMPGAADETIAVLERNVSQMPPISNLVSSEKGPKELLDLLTAGLPVIIHEERPVKYECKCSKERLERVLINLGIEELRDIIDTQGKAELTCHFCAEQYEFNRAELEALIHQIQDKSI
ncbi:MAG TPA: Hsp33 family molecular chaperone HslO [Candidatus Deferrimicrobium sp.]|nr:Hsp33 family molecular chaperone HslO [Candidatus Deferrimicrobium sp.]